MKLNETIGLKHLECTEKQKGFTLIEILITISIIGILSSMVIVTLTNVKSKSRDTQRKTDLRNIKASLEIYFADQSPSVYVGAATAETVSDRIFGGSAQIYMKNIPVDPSTSEGHHYMYQTDGSPYKNFLLTCNLENNSDVERKLTGPTGYGYTMPTDYDYWIQND